MAPAVALQLLNLGQLAKQRPLLPGCQLLPGSLTVPNALMGQLLLTTSVCWASTAGPKSSLRVGKMWLLFLFLLFFKLQILVSCENLG